MFLQFSKKNWILPFFLLKIAQNFPSVSCKLILIACKSDLAELPKIYFSVALLTENLRSCRLDLGRFLAYLMTLMALKAAADINQAAANVNLGVKAITNVKKSAKATADIKPLTRSVDWPNFQTIKMVKLVAIFEWAELPKSLFSVARPGQIYRLLV